MTVVRVDELYSHRGSIRSKIASPFEIVEILVTTFGC